jgi:hypothetical protein
MSGSWLRKLRWRTEPSKLIIPAFKLAGQSGHYFNELLGYKTAAEDLGVLPKIFVPRTTEPQDAAVLGASAILDLLPPVGLLASAQVVNQWDAFLDASERLDCLWDAIEAEGLSDIRAILFPQGHPIVIRAAGLWLGRVPAHLRLCFSDSRGA